MKISVPFYFATMLLASSLAQAVDLKPFSMAAVQDAQQSGKPHAIHFHADWCPVCRAQEKVLQNLKDDKEVDLPVFVANYDKEKELKQKLGIRTQSTLVVFRGAEEKARLAGDADNQNIKAALKKAF